MIRYFLFLFLFLIPFSLCAHSSLSAISIKDGDSLLKAPKNIKLFFKSPTKLIKVEVRALQAKKDKNFLSSFFGNSDGEQIPLGKEFLFKSSKIHIITFPLLASRSYSFEWRAIGEDGHVIKDKFFFQVTDK